MIFRQLFEPISFTYSYLIASRRGGEARIIDYSFIMQDRVFTGDTLMIRGTGRTDFQNGDPRIQYQSLGRLLRLPDETLVARVNQSDG